MPAPSWSGLRDDLRALQTAALAAADPAAAVTRSLRLGPGGLRAGDETLELAPDARVWLVALGKASPGMARAAVATLGSRLAGGVVAHPRGADLRGGWPASLRFHGAGHPLPDEGSLAAGADALALLRGTAERDVVVILVSGGGSALFEALRPGVTLADLRSVTEALQRAGADIVELNTVRRALSLVKAGGLARAAAPARVVALLLSDVVGDRPEAIASGPTVASPTGPAEACGVLERRGLRERFSALADVLRGAVAAPLDHPAAGPTLVVGSSRLAARALCAAAEARGFRALLLTDRLQGEAREVGRVIGALARGPRESGLPFPPPTCLVAGGETTVTVRGRGCGGRNLELALGAAQALAGCARTAVLSFATDGVDGSSGAAGALATGDTLARAEALGRSAERALGDNDTAPFFDALGDLWVTGPSGTNVNDLVVVLAYP